MTVRVFKSQLYNFEKSMITCWFTLQQPHHKKHPKTKTSLKTLYLCKNRNIFERTCENIRKTCNQSINNDNTAFDFFLLTPSLNLDSVLSSLSTLVDLVTPSSNNSLSPPSFPAPNKTKKGRVQFFLRYINPFHATELLLYIRKSIYV